jgi:putative N6-adenine-specific DNA methylase
MSSLELIATAAFGLEAVIARELVALGYSDQTVEDGRVRFRGDISAIARCNLWLRSADRLLLQIGEFNVHDFGELFDRTTELPWERWLPATAEFPIRGRSVNSQLRSVPNCQRIVKRAVVECLKRRYQRDWFEETGPTYSIEVSLLKNRATLTIDTSGAGLHKRGYRKLVGAAPLKETLAAALVQLSYWNESRQLVDPCCGTGTIPIEAALIGRNTAPGLSRSFAAEAWPQIPSTVWNDARSEARDSRRRPLDFRIIGTDVDHRPLTLARNNATAAGVDDSIHFQQQPLAEFTTSRKYGCVISNPPYGERLGTQSNVRQLYRDMGRLFAPLDTWSIYILTAHADFERDYGRRADRRRKLYNARIPCTYYQFNGPRPPR